MPAVWAVVVAGGSGSRFGQPKQFAPLAGHPVLWWAVESCRSVAEGVVLVLPAGAECDDHGADLVVTGGPTRSASVRCGLDAVPPSAEVVVVHDAARPLATPATFRAVVDALGDQVAGAVCALPVADTVKAVEPPLGSGRTSLVVATVDRSTLVAVQTPQAFTAAVLRRAHHAGDDATDDAGLVEALGATVAVVAGDQRNLKITTPADLAYAEHLLLAP